MKKTTYISLLLIFIFQACTPGNKYRASYDFPGEVWKRFENPTLQFDIGDPGTYYDMFFQINYDPAVDLKNFAVTVIMTTPSGEERSRDLDLDFSQGKKAGGHSELTAVLRRDYAFADKGKCYFEIENRSSEMNTRGIKNVGIFMQKSQ